MSRSQTKKPTPQEWRLFAAVLCGVIVVGVAIKAAAHIADTCHGHSCAYRGTLGHKALTFGGAGLLALAVFAGVAALVRWRIQPGNTFAGRLAALNRAQAAARSDRRRAAAEARQRADAAEAARLRAVAEGQRLTAERHAALRAKYPHLDPVADQLRIQAHELLVQLVQLKRKRTEIRRPAQMIRAELKSDGDLRWRIFARDNYTCQRCGATGASAELTIDHITPVSLGGTNAEANLQALCRSCNSRKGAR